MNKLIDTTINYSTIFTIMDQLLAQQGDDLAMREYIQWREAQNGHQFRDPAHQLPNFHITLECNEQLEEDTDCDTTEPLYSDAEEEYYLPSDDDLTMRFSGDDEYYADL